MTFRLLRAFESPFRGQPYRHRHSTQGDAVAVELYEDLCALGASPKFNGHVTAKSRGLGPKNKTVSLKRMRRGDGTFGVLIDAAKARAFPGYAIARGPLATLDIGVEVKILNKAMQKQIDRVLGDLEKQVKQWRRLNKTGRLISVAVVGVNYADYTVGYEGPDRAWKTDGAKYPHPVDEAPKVLQRIVHEVVDRNVYDEVLVLKFKARNDPPFHFDWVDQTETEAAYQAVLQRLAQLYESRF